MQKFKYVPVNNFLCLKCKTKCISWHVHDFVSCPCGNFTDGGFDYCRQGGKATDMVTMPLFMKKEIQTNERA